MKLTSNILKEILKEIEKECIGNRFTRMSFITNHTISFALSFNLEKRFVIDLDNYNPLVYIDSYNEAYTSIISNKIGEVLKNEITGSVIKSLEVFNEDKIVKCVFNKTNQYYEKVTTLMYIELIPYHPNLIITKEDNTIIAAYRESELTSVRPLLRGIKYITPTKNINENYENAFNLSDYMDLIEARHNQIVNQNKIDKVKEIKKFLSNKIKNLTNKIKKLEKEIELSQEHLIYKDVADYLSYSRFEFIGNEAEYDGKIYKLDPLKSLNQNIQSLYKKYKKSKNGIIYINEQIEKTKNELHYYESLLNSLIDLDEIEIKELKQELNIERKSPQKRDKKAKITLNVIKDGEVKYIYGKNAIQNEYLSFEIANKEDNWFHIKDYSGSHLIISKQGKVDEEELLTAAELIILLAHQESGDVNHAIKRNIKKGNYPGEVNLLRYNTIHVSKIRETTRQLLLKVKKN